MPSASLASRLPMVQLGSKDSVHSLTRRVSSSQHHQDYAEMHGLRYCWTSNFVCTHLWHRVQGSSACLPWHSGVDIYPTAICSSDCILRTQLSDISWSTAQADQLSVFSQSTAAAGACISHRRMTASLHSHRSDVFER